jgi:oligoendopeptidase F
MMSKITYTKRSEIHPDYTWDLTHMITSKDEWNQIYKQIQELLNNVSAYKGQLTLSAKTLYDALELRSDLFILFHRIYVYSNMKLHEDTGDNASQEAVQKVNGLDVKINSQLAFFEPELMTADISVIQEYMASYAPLSKYTHFFDNLFRQKKHILPKEHEELLALAGDFTGSPSEIFSMFMNADLVLPEIQDEDGNKLPLSLGSYQRYIKSKDRTLRKNAFEGLHQKMKDHTNTLTSIYLASLKKDVFEMRARKYSTSCEASLSGKNIDISVYDNLIQTVHDHLPLLHRYVRLRKKMLNHSELHMYDLYTPLVNDVDQTITYEEGKKIVLDSLKPLGDDYLELVNKGFSERWIDVYENKGKRSGAYSWGTYDRHPYILLNHQDTLNSTFTLAHEMGHALHSYYSNSHQPYIYHSYPIFLAEVASTVNESLLIQHLLTNAKEKNQKLYLLNYYMESFRTTLYRQVMFAEFEKKAHDLLENGDPITSDGMFAIYKDLNQTYYGDDIIVDDLIGYEWSRIPHFYNAFYVYQYATGFSAAVALSKNILEGGLTAADHYKNFLKSGSSKYPIDILKEAGVDMTQTTPIEEALSVFENLLNEMESLV